MSLSFKKDSSVIESRYLLASLVVFGTTFVLLFRLWYLQVYKGKFYTEVSENNRMRRIEIPAPRGLIYDREGRIILGNRPFFDLVAIPQYMQDEEQTLKLLSHLLHVPFNTFHKSLRAQRGQPKFLPVLIKKNLSVHQVSLIESNKVFLPGVEVQVAPRRDYKRHHPVHLLGYMSEINRKSLKKRNQENPENPYQPGELIGQQGLEARWEDMLRGKRGHRLIQVDAFGREIKGGEEQTALSYPVTPAAPGSDLILTIDFDLQKTVQKAFSGKYGAVVALNPQNGEVYAMVSSPTYDPSIYQENLSYDKWQSLLLDPFKPLFDKTTGGAFAPGSVYKPVVALAALEENIVTAQKTLHCNGSFSLGRDTFHCHRRGGHGHMGLKDALKKSCDLYFYQIGVELGVDRIAKYAFDLGLGKKLGVKVNYEDPGLIPTQSWKKRVSKTGWALGDIPSMAIGQGANLLTPMQIANLYATIGNGGRVYRPFIVKKVKNYLGETIFEENVELLHQVEYISQKNLKKVREYLGAVVMENGGSGFRARVAGVQVAGKTGSVQVVGLNKNRNKNSIVSMKWKEHALFAAFAPVENPEIAIAVVSENDSTAGGSVSAAPIAQKILAAFFAKKKQRDNRLSRK